MLDTLPMLVLNSWKQSLRWVASTTLDGLRVIWGGAVVVLIVMIRPALVLRIGEIESRAIGHFSLPMETYWAEWRAGIHRRPPRSIDLYFMNRKISNDFLERHWREEYVVVPRFLFQGCFEFLLKHAPRSRHLVPYRHWSHTAEWNLFDIHGALDRTPPSIRLSPSTEAASWRQLEGIGVQRGSPLALFIARDSAYRESGRPSLTTRDSDIQDFEAAVALLTSNGYTCVRMGKSAQNPFEHQDARVVDYAFSDVRSDALDIFLCRHCDFILGGPTGLTVVPMMFRRPWVAVPAPVQYEYRHYGLQQIPLMVPTAIRYIDSGGAVPLSEIVRLDLDRSELLSTLEVNGMSHCASTKSDIASAVVDFLEMRVNPEEDEGTQELRTRFASHYSRLRPDDPWLPLRVGKTFLHANPWLLS